MANSRREDGRFRHAIRNSPRCAAQSSMLRASEPMPYSGLRTPPMSKRPLHVLAVALLAVAVFWALSIPRKPQSDEARYQQWGRPVDSYARLVFVERHVPASLFRLLHLPAREQRYMDKNEE